MSVQHERKARSVSGGAERSGESPKCGEPAAQRRSGARVVELVDGVTLPRVAQNKVMSQVAQRTVFTMPRLGGSGQLSDLVLAYGGEELVARDFRIAPQLLRSYLAGVIEPPHALFLAIYWQGPYGFAQAFRESHWTHQATVARATVAEAKVAQYETLLRTLRPLLGSDSTLQLLLSSHGLDVPQSLSPQQDEVTSIPCDVPG